MYEPTIIEYKNMRVLTTQQIAEAYETEQQIITNNFNRNKERYIEGKHYICLTGQEKADFIKKNQNDFSSYTKAKAIYLWTQTGTLFHAKSLNTDIAWEVYDKLVDSYFMKSPSIDLDELDPETKLMNLLVQSISRNELETKRIAAEQKQIKETVEIQGKAIQTVKETFTKGASEQETTQWVNHCITKIAESPNFMFTFGNRYAAARNESYQRLTTKAGCRLDQKVRNAIARAEEKGSTQAQKNNINKLTVIMADRRLKEIYVGVIKEMMIAYCVEASVKGVQA